MKKDVIQRSAAILTVVMFLSNDLLAVTRLLAHGIPNLQVANTLGYGSSHIPDIQEGKWQNEEEVSSSELVVSDVGHQVFQSVEQFMKENEGGLPASALDFEVLDTLGDAVAYPSVISALARIPDHILNITRNAEAFHLNSMAGSLHHIAIGVDAKKLKSFEDLARAQVYYFDTEAKQWLEAVKVKVDDKQLRIEAMVPGATDYFAGLIQAPEMPEASAYVPTSISDIEPANPATGIRLMQPPTVNRMGTANIEYPLWIPEGRAGMTPQLALTYNSDAGTGWLGVGWNIGSSSISVDTKWGVPIYDQTYETEGYLLDGEALFEQGGKRPERADIGVDGKPMKTLRSGPKKYLPRVVSSYNVIERIGAGPDSHVWVITDASGTKRYYGTTNGTQVDNNSVLRKGTSGAIAQWFLTKVVDKWGNSILYSYEQVLGDGSVNPIEDEGVGKYLKEIQYTGFGEEAGKYLVKFKLKEGPNSRRDALVRMNFGFKTIDNKLLKGIEAYIVEGGSERILVSYNFDYSNDINSQFKTRLIELSEFRPQKSDQSLIEFYSHIFEYKSGQLEFENPIVLDPKYDVPFIKDAPFQVADMVPSIYQQFGKGSLGLTKIQGKSAHGGAAIGPDVKPVGITFFKTNTVGLYGSYSQHFADELKSFQDFNGDGIPDFIIRNEHAGKTFYVPLLISRSGSQAAFSIGTPRTIPVSSLSKRITTSSSISVQRTGPKVPPPTKHFGLSTTWGSDVTLRSVLDFNSDGFPDLIEKRGSSDQVLFGRLTESGEYLFSSSSERTYNPIYFSQGIDAPLASGQPGKKMEVVRVWKAPVTGTVSISGSCTLPIPSSEVAISIQKNSSIVYSNLSVTHQSGINISEVVNVTKGDLLLFRVNPLNSSQGDFVNWNPSVEYQGVALLDGQGNDWGSTTPEDGFILSSGQITSFPDSRKFRVLLNLSSSVTLSDDAIIRIELYQGEVSLTSYSHKINAGTFVNPDPSFAPFLVGNQTLVDYFDPINIPGYSSISDEPISILFRIVSPSNLDWDKLKWFPVVQLEPSCTDPINDYYPVPHILTYNSVQKHFEGQFVSSINPGEHYQFSPFIDIPNQIPTVSNLFSSKSITSSESVNFVVKSNGMVIQRVNIQFRPDGTFSLRNSDLDNHNLYPDYSGLHTIDPMQYIPVSGTFFLGDLAQNEVYFEFYSDGPLAMELSALVKESLQGIFLNSENSGLIEVIDGNNTSHYITEANELGINFLNWGCFAWSTTDPSAPIDVADLTFPLNTSMDESTFESLIQSNPNAISGDNYSFFSLVPVRGEIQNGLWQYHLNQMGTNVRSLDRFSFGGSSLSVFNNGKSASPFIFGEIDYPSSFEETQEEEPSSSSNVNFAANGVLSETSNLGLYGSTGIVFPLNMGKAALSGSTIFSINSVSKTKNLMLDVNGDRYPDLLFDQNGVGAQYSNPLGGHSGIRKSVDNNHFISKSTNVNISLGIGGSFRGTSKSNTLFDVSGDLEVKSDFSEQNYTYIDINGDGLLDAYSTEEVGAFTLKKFRLNTGGIFVNDEILLSNNSGFGVKNYSYRVTFSQVTKLENFIGSGDSYANSISFGRNVNRTGTRSKEVFLDFNGDGLIDFLELENIVWGDDCNYKLYLNTGTSFEMIFSNTKYPNMNDNFGLGIAGQASFTMGPIFNFLKLPITAGYSEDWAANYIKNHFIDINGDGAPDFLSINDELQIEVRFAKHTLSNKLSKVIGPLGASFELDYEVVGNQRGFYDPKIKTHLSDVSNERILWDMPMGKIVLSKVVVDDGCNLLSPGSNPVDLDGSDNFVTGFEYDGGIYSRRERQFLGFSRVCTNEVDFHNTNLYVDNILFDEIDNNSSLQEITGIERVNICPISDPNEICSRGPIRRFNQTVYDYHKLMDLSPDSVKRYFFFSGNLLSKYSQKRHLWDVVVANTSVSGPGRERIIHRDAVLLVSSESYSYENRWVNNTLGSSFGQAIIENPQNHDWILYKEVIEAGGNPEIQTVFNAVTSFSKLSFPVVYDRDFYNIQKFNSKYDNYFNVIEYADAGVCSGSRLDTIIVDTIFFGYDKTIVQENSANATNWSLVDLGDRQYSVTVACNDPSYEDAILYGTFPGSDCETPPAPGTGPLFLGEAFFSEHHKWVADTGYVFDIVDDSPCVDRVIAVMQYFEPGSAAGRTNALEFHQIYKNSIDPANMMRHSRVTALNATLKSPASIAQVLGPDENVLEHVSLTDLKYDQYGNVITLTGPENGMATAQKVVTEFEYDGVVHQFVNRISNSYNEFFCNKYDFGFQNLLQTTDVNGYSMRFAYDDFQRPQYIWAPRELANPQHGPTIAYSYDLGLADGYSVAFTHHNTGNKRTTISQGSQGDACMALIDVSGFETSIDSAASTATFIDGVGRVMQIQTKIDAQDDQLLPLRANKTKMLVSGTEELNRFGLTIARRNDFVGENSNFGTLQKVKSDVIETTVYNYLKQVVNTQTVQNTDNENLAFSEQTVARRWSSDQPPLYSEETSMEAQTFVETFFDAKGRKVRVRNHGGSVNEVTNFTYDPLGQLLTVVDPANAVTTYLYDFFGRPIEENHPDRGKTETTYDLAGNITSIKTPATGTGFISFEYNFNRMIKKTMPSGSDFSDIYNVVFTYGAKGDGKNGAGRVVSVVQGNSSNPVLVENLKYDELGQTIEQVRAIDMPQNPVIQTKTMGFRYDSFGRMLRMSYPDGENLSYVYTSNGALQSVRVNYPNCNSLPNVINAITYDGYGNMKYLEYGNGTFTEYGYHPITRAMVSNEVNGHPFAPFGSGSMLPLLRRAYTYDNLGMITKYTASPHRSMTLAGDGFSPVNGRTKDYNIVTDYEYDGILRLKNSKTSLEAVAIFNTDPDPSNMPALYDYGSGTEVHMVETTYGPSGRMATKTSQDMNGTHFLAGSNLEYALSYQYQGGTPHQLSSVTETTPAGAANIAFTYNTSGSLTKMEKTLGSTTQTEDLYWNEEQQLVGVHNGNGLHHYVYDYRGERILKASYTQTGTSINDNPLTGSGSISGYTAYFNPYVVANYAVFPPFQIEEATHHYYMGAQRVASGRFASDANLYEGNSTGPGTPLRQAEDTSSKPDAVLDQLEWLLQQAGYVEGEDYTRESLEQPTPMAELYPAFSGSAQQRNDPPIEDLFEPRQFTEYTFCTPWVTEVYWYHPNYLGSVDLVTDLSGHAHQYFMYTAWGEPMFENSSMSGGFDAPYRFNGKELDKETGLGYYGARYYQNRLGMWLSVDPLAAAVPSMTPYRFSFNNPVNITDPTGLLESTDVTLNDDGSYTVREVHDDGDNNIYVVDDNGNRTGEVVGKTEYWDEFMNHDREGNTTTPMKGAKINKMNVESFISSLNQEVINKRKEEGLYSAAKWTRKQSDGRGNDENLFDIKKTLGSQTGYYYKGYFYSGRSLGNMLAGMNAAVLKPSLYKASDWWKLTIQLAGDLHMKSNNLGEMPHDGRWRGEIEYAGRMIFKGFNIVRRENGWFN